jgi:hypothetical protein
MLRAGEDSLIGLCCDQEVWGPSTAFPFAIANGNSAQDDSFVEFA